MWPSHTAASISANANAGSCYLGATHWLVTSRKVVACFRMNTGRNAVKLAEIVSRWTGKGAA